jgi:uncharacterized protein YaiI (UPF0178 family)
MSALYIDADACPVKAEAERVATRHKCPVFMVSNGGLRPSTNPLVQMITVPDGPDIADMWIADRAGQVDIVVTGDIPLAAKVIASGAQVIKHDGSLLTARNIGDALATRDLMQDIRAANPFAQGGGRPFSKADRARFLDKLEMLMRQMTR